MKMSIRTGVVFSGLFLAGQGFAAPPPPLIPPAAQKAAESISAERIRTHVRFLSNDLLEGRGPGTRGGQLAAEYMATQFALSGLKPAGEAGTYFQRVPLIAVHTVEDQTKFAFVPPHDKPISLQYGDDIVAKDETGQEIANIDAPIVFAGYGIDAPEYEWNDFNGVDVKGKVLLVIVNEPPSSDAKFFKGKALTYYGRWTYKYEEGARLGAIGVIVIHRDDLASYGWAVVRNSQSVEKSYLRHDPLSTLRAAAWITLPTARRLFAAAGMDADHEIEAAGKRGFKPVELPIRLHAHIVSKVRSYESMNVIGMVPGKDSAPGESVIYSAHYDHLGVDPTLPGDKIYNGAADNGTGCGILLELARAYAESSTPPPHNTYFASVTAEEQGLLGSEYLGMHPPVAAKDLILNLNYDMLLPVGIPASTDVEGAERTSFYPAVARTAAAFGLKIEPDDNPMAGYYYRSDHFSFARVGIPAFSIGQGDLFVGHDREWGRRQQQEFEAERYHRPSDEYRPSMDFRGDAKMARFGFYLGWEAMSAGNIHWNHGDEFEAARKNSLNSVVP
jgi:Zn-dependent M28 family amino/carboxypeptidase